MNTEALPTPLVERWPARDLERSAGEAICAFVGIARGVAVGAVVWIGLCWLVWLSA